MRGFIYVPASVASTPTDGECITDRWWTMHPEKGLAFWRTSYREPPAPQCNASEATARYLTERLHRDGDHGVALVPVVYLGHAARAARVKP